jgi:two-component system response regulator AtoC
MSATGIFRVVLFFRIADVAVNIPPLGSREGDAELLARHFLRKFAAGQPRAPTRFGADALAAINLYTWPGNVRELENLIERAMVLCRGDLVTVAHLPAGLGPLPPVAPESGVDPKSSPRVSDSLALRPHVDELERHLIHEALLQAGGNKAAAARLLEISERALWYKIKRYGLA